jgi:Bacterial PH domain
MYILPTSNFLKRNLQINKKRSSFPKIRKPVSHRSRVLEELRNLGVSKGSLSTMESRYLPTIIHPDEHIGGVVYGDGEEGFVMLVATDRRIIFLDKKPFFINEDEINYGVVSGVKYSHAGFGTTITLHTRIKDYKIMTFNKKCAEGFVKYIEHHIELRSLERNYKGDEII